MNTESPLTAIKGVGAKTAEGFAALGVHTVGELLMNFPRDYSHYPSMVDLNELDTLIPFTNYALHVQIRQSPVVHQGRMPVTVLKAGDEGHRIELIWFRQPYLRSTLIPGKHFVFYGKISVRNNHFVMEQPQVFEVEKYQLIADTLQPVYSLTSGVTNHLVIRTVMRALDQETMFEEFLPADIRSRNHLCEYNYAVKQIHFPDSMDSLILARKRLVYDEFFLFILGVQYGKEKKVRRESRFDLENEDRMQEWIARLPYPLTGAQERTLRETVKDMKSGFAMERLIQGDVGSGKTILAFLLMAWVSENGYQSAIMAPTEVLARQHYETFRKTCQMLGLQIPVVLLTGSQNKRQRREALERLKLFPNAMIIGTHALIQDPVEYSHLALVITDEQHRFGVRQRENFSEKGETPHILVMSATPIPRTLAIILYGDMDISVVDQVPARRLPIKNCVVSPAYRPKAFSFIEKEAAAGHQAYIICPFVEASEEMEGENVTDYSKMLMSQLPEEIRVGVLHGKMKPAMKDKVMSAFSSGQIQVLVSTTVVEVGVNVPNATVMMVENADRFGLAQLHQLRGRVGRGDAQSYCIFVNASSAESAKKRLDILNKSNDGFFIAGQDLKLRGPGDFFGIRQSGDLAFRLADVYQDAAVLQSASEDVKQLLEEDPDLTAAEHRGLRRRCELYMQNEWNKMSL